MELMRVAVCDDDTTALNIISNSLEGIFSQRGVEVNLEPYSSALELAEVMQRRKFDLLLLDIDMPGLDGISFAKTLREQGNQVDVMYISSREDKVFESLRIHPIGFIRKSRFLEEMPEIVGAYLDTRAARNEVSSIVLKKAGLVRPLRADAIAYIEGKRKDQSIHLVESSTITIRSTMQALEDELVGAGFIRIHQGYLVNYRQIELIEDQEVLLSSGERLPISRRKAAAVRAKYLEYVQKNDEFVF